MFSLHYITCVKRIYIAHEESEIFVVYVIHGRPLGKATPATT